jgi:transposase InsO family protein
MSEAATGQVGSMTSLLKSASTLPTLNATEPLGDPADRFTVLIRDRAGQFTATFDAVLTDAGITVCKIPPRSPQANAYAERFVGAVRREVTDHMLIVGERHLRRTLDQYARHYNGWRPHRALSLQPPRSDRPAVDLTHERVKRQPVLGGLINEYERAAERPKSDHWRGF